MGVGRLNNDIGAGHEKAWPTLSVVQRNLGTFSGEPSHGQMRFVTYVPLATCVTHVTATKTFLWPLNTDIPYGADFVVKHR